MTITLDAITLPDDLIWIDEYAYSPVKQTQSIAVDGTLIIEAAAQLKGRPITLQGGTDYAWIDKATLEALRAKQYQAGLSMTLTLRGTAFNVLFAHPDGLDAKAIIDYSNPDSTDFYTLTLKFIEV